MRYKPKGVAALQMILGGFPDTMRVEIDDNIGVSAKTVGELRKLATWPGNLAVTTPDAVYPESTVKVAKASGPKRKTIARGPLEAAVGVADAAPVVRAA